MKAYKLKFLSSFHIDAGSAVDGPSESHIHSDTLFSALVSAARKFYGNEVVGKFLEPGAILISSAFPYYKDEFFLPKPLHFFPDNLQEYEMIKVFKRAKFISKDLLLKIISGQSIEEIYYSKEHILNGCWRINENVKNFYEEDNIFESQEVPHIVMDRITNQTQIFYKTEIYFNKNAGLYFIAEINNDIIKQFETILRFLGDEGIGADRTIGKGLFEVEEVNNLSLPISSKTEFYYLLSLYSPTREEFDKIDPKKSFYDFKIRGGWISNNTLNRKNLRMFIEGSVLKFSDTINPTGCLHKVLEADKYPNDLKYDIFRCGQALFLPVTGGINDN